jgi:hypothetical protein
VRRCVHSAVALQSFGIDYLFKRGRGRVDLRSRCFHRDRFGCRSKFQLQIDGDRIVRQKGNALLRILPRRCGCRAERFRIWLTRVISSRATVREAIIQPRLYEPTKCNKIPMN